MESDIGFQAALEEARKGASEGGVPIGACLVSVRRIEDASQELSSQSGFLLDGAMATQARG